MKTLFSIFLSLFFSYAFSQPYSHMLKENAVWTVVESSMFDDYFYTYEYRLTDEITVMEGKNYRLAESRKKISYGDWGEWQPDKFYLAEIIASRRVYIYYISDSRYDYKEGELDIPVILTPYSGDIDPLRFWSI